LQRDGDIVGTNGYQRLVFSVTADNSFIAVRHRNHLGVMTATSQALNSAQRVIDFSVPSLSTYGTAARASLTPQVSGQWSGNVFRDTQLKYTGTNNDRDPILTQIGGTIPTDVVPGYFKSDVNMDGVVKYTGANNDRDPIIVNLGGNAPNAVKNEQLP
jgi:hypothetical protein